MWVLLEDVSILCYFEFLNFFSMPPPPSPKSWRLNNFCTDSSLVSGGSVPERPSAPDLQPTSRLAPRKLTLKDPLDMTNPDYELHLQETKHKPTTDFIKTNKV